MVSCARTQHKRKLPLEATTTTTRFAKTSLNNWIHHVSKFIAQDTCFSICQMLANFFWAWILKDWIRKSLSCVFTSPTKYEMMQFCVLIVQRRQKNVQKSVMYVQRCSFVNLNLLLFLPFSLPLLLFKLPDNPGRDRARTSWYGVQSTSHKLGHRAFHQEPLFWVQ